MARSSTVRNGGTGWQRMVASLSAMAKRKLLITSSCAVIRLNCWDLCTAYGGFNIESHIPLLNSIKVNCDTPNTRTIDGQWKVTFPHLLWNI
nr:hypothetical protein Itr_chr01CG07190 [Ipomoea trifida]